MPAYKERTKENLLEYGQLLIKRYLPPDMWVDLNNITFDEFFILMAKAEVVRDMYIDDIRVGTAKAIVDTMGDK